MFEIQHRRKLISSQSDNIDRCKRHSFNLAREQGTFDPPGTDEFVVLENEIPLVGYRWNSKNQFIECFQQYF